MATQAYDDYGNMISRTDSNNNTTQYIYDSRQSCSIYKSFRHGTIYTYDGLSNQLSVTNADGMVTEYSYDGKSFRTSKISDKDGIAAKETYERDELMNLVSSIDAFDVRTAYVYDSVYRLVDTI